MASVSQKIFTVALILTVCVFSESGTFSHPDAFCHSISSTDHVNFNDVDSIIVIPNDRTDSTYVFIFLEESPPLYLYQNVSPNVLNRLGFAITRAGCFLIYICIAWVKCIPYIKPRYIMSASRKQKRNEVKKRLRIICLFLSRPRRLLKQQ